MNRFIRRALALIAAAIIACLGVLQACAEGEKVRQTETGYPLLAEVEKELYSYEIVRPRDVTITQGDSFELVDRDWFGNEDEPAHFVIETHAIYKPDGHKGSFSSDIPGRYKVYYVIRLFSGNPSYEVSRTVTVNAKPVDETAAEEQKAENAEGIEADEHTETVDEPAHDTEETQDAAYGQEDVREEDYSPEQEEKEPEQTDDGEHRDVSGSDDTEELTESVPADEYMENGDSAQASEDDAADETETVDEPETEDADNEEACESETGDESMDAVMQIQTESPENEATEQFEETESEQDDESGDIPGDEIAEDATHDENDDGSETGAGEDVPENGDEENASEDESTEDDDDVPVDNIVITGNATLVRGERIKYPADLGDHSTFKYVINGKIAYCLQSDKASPRDGSFKQNVFDSNAGLNKALYYGYGGAGDLSEEFFPDYSSGLRYIMTHMAASYMYTGDYSKATTNCTSSGLSKYRFDEWVQFLSDQPDPPSPGIELTSENLSITSKRDGVQTTSETKLRGDSRNFITISLPDGVTYHNKNTGETVDGGNVKVHGGTTFYFTAPLSMDGTWESGEMKGSISNVWKALVITTGTKTQDLGCYAVETYSSAVHFSVAWESETALTIIKADADNNDEHIEGAVFGIYADSECSILLGRVTTGQNGSATVSFPRNYGTVYIREEIAPDGYILNDGVYSVDLSRKASVTVMITDEKQAPEIRGRIRIVKEGETIVGYENGKFIYGPCYMNGVVFEVYAAEDIYTSEKKTTIALTEGALAARLVTEGRGEVFSDELPIGRYYVIETETPAGYIPDTEKHYITLAHEGQDEEVTVSTVSIQNKRQKVSITVEKQSEDGKSKLAGAVFGLYAGEAINANGSQIVAAGTCLATAKTDSTGHAAFDIDLPFGKYLISELQAPAGYILSDEVREITVSPGKSEVVTIKEVFKNDPVRVAISKADITTGVELDGAKLTLLDKNGNVIETWVSIAGKPHMMEGLTVGETYTLREDTAPYGYLISESVKFTVNGNGEVQKVVMYDKAPTGTLIINKSGEFLSGYNAIDSAVSWVTNAFDYITGSLRDVTFDVYAYTEITHPDKVTASYYAAGEYVATIKTDSSGVATLEGLPLGKYYVVETGTADGYLLDREKRIIDLSYRDSATAVVRYSEAWQNERRRISISVVKLDEKTEQPLEGAAFGLYAAEDIKVNGKTVLKKNTLIEQKASGTDGKLVFESDLPVGYSFYVKEVLPPSGYASCPDARVFRFSADSPAQIEYSFADKVTQLLISKTNIAGDELPGAKLTILNAKGETVASWVSTDKPHYIEMLPVGKYTLREESAPAGYLISEDVTFEITDTAEVQKVTMVDKVKKTDPSTPPKMGDDRNPVLWLAMTGCGILGVVVLLAMRIRRRR